jgi:hypothetical protein
MSVFRRKKDAAADTADEAGVAPEAVAPEEGAAVAPAGQTAAAGAADAAPARPQGPWDEADAPQDEVPRVDLGGLRVPVPPDTEVRVDVSPEGQVVAATLVRGQSAMQVNAFAAPRSAGIWQEVREEIASALQEGGGRAAEVDGTYGVELHAVVPTEVPGQGRALAPARFLGVDGPRWFLRALLTGPAATDADQARPLIAALQGVVVVRGGEAMAVRDPLPLRLPKEVAAAAAPPSADATPDGAAPPSTDATPDEAASDVR